MHTYGHIRAVAVEADALLQIQREGMIDARLAQDLFSHGIEMLLRSLQLGHCMLQPLAAELGAGGERHPPKRRGDGDRRV